MGKSLVERVGPCGGIDLMGEGLMSRGSKMGREDGYEGTRESG